MANGVLDREDRDVEEEHMRQPSTATIQKGVLAMKSYSALWKMVDNAMTTFVFLAYVMGMCAMAGEQNKETRLAGKTQAFDAKKAIDAIASRNPEPSIFGEAPDKKALFEKSYDWKDQKRVEKAIQLLVDHVEEAWPELVNHYSDNRYCITYEAFDNATNFTVGGVCHWIIADALTEPSLRNWPRRAGIHVLFRLREPLLDPNEDLQKWCLARRDKKLYELQIEVCQIAIAKVPTIIPELSDLQRHDLIKAIELEIASLQKTHKSVGITRWGKRLNLIRYSPKDAERMRQEYWESNASHPQKDRCE
jgi:hypothetical protein